MSRQQLLLDSVDTFFHTKDNAKTLSDILEKKLDPKKGLSLRTIEWFVTTHSKKKNLTYKTGDKRFTVHVAYKSSLDGYSKKLFDPFCRTERIEYEIPGHGKVTTTVAQLNFLKWCISNGVIQYIQDNKIKSARTKE